MSPASPERLAQAIQLHQAGKLAEAEAIYREVLAADPMHAQVHNNRGVALQNMQRYEEALASYDQAIKLGADIPDIHFNRGLALYSLERFDEALAAYDRAIALRPDYAAAFNNRGNAFSKLKRYEEAVVSFDMAIALQPNFADAHNNRANALRYLRRIDEAVAAYTRAIALKPDFTEAYYNRGLTQQEARRFEEALADYDHTLAHAPDHPEAQWSKGFTKLLTEDYAEGWPLYEWRWKLKEQPPPARSFSQPLWLGNFDINGKTILLHAEQGIGDTIHFCRYARLVKAKGAKIILEVQPTLKTLLQSLEGADQVIAQGEPLPPFDCHCPLLSLPFATRTTKETIPADIPYLHASEQLATDWSKKLGEKRRPRVGLVWAGNSKQKNDHNRSMLLLDLLPLIGNKNVEFISLQKDVAPADQVVLSAAPDIRNLGVTLPDFANAAALVSLMDLVITVDTSVAHLAGALGKPLWIFVSYIACWRWLLDRNDSPWYPTARLFRQSDAGNWANAVAEVGKELDRQFPHP